MWSTWRRILSHILIGVMWLGYVDDILANVPRDLILLNSLIKISLLSWPSIWPWRLNMMVAFPFFLCLGWNSTKLNLNTLGSPQTKITCYRLLHHNERAKRGVIIGFYLRVYRTFSTACLQQQCNYMHQAFSTHRYRTPSPTIVEE